MTIRQRLWRILRAEFYHWLEKLKVVCRKLPRLDAYPMLPEKSPERRRRHRNPSYKQQEALKQWMKYRSDNKQNEIKYKCDQVIPITNLNKEK